MDKKHFDKLWKILEFGGFSTNEEMRDTFKMVLLSVLVGIIGAVGAMCFYGLVDLTKYSVLNYCSGYHVYFQQQGIPLEAGNSKELFHPPDIDFHPYILLFLPALGGIASGLLIYFFAPEAKGSGTDGVMEAYHYHGGKIRSAVPITKAIASAITIGSGGSAGKEGPIAQIGAGMASVLAGLFRLNKKQTRILIMAGLAAGIGAIFRAPLAAALFAAEVLYREMDIEKDTIVPAIISSIIAYAIFASIFGWSHLFNTPEMRFEQPLELIPYTGVAIFVAIGGHLFTWIFHQGGKVFEKIPLPSYAKPALGGLLVGCVGLWIPEAMAEGYGIIQGALSGNENVTLGLLVAVALGKMVTTTFTISSGGSGGVFGPSVVIGGCLGGIIGLAAQQWFPSLHVGAFVIVGMAGFFSGAAKTPISTIIMVSELTGNYRLLVPTMWVCIIAYLINRRLTLFDKQLRSRFDAPAELQQMMSEILTRMKVKDAHKYKKYQEFVTLREDQHVEDVINAFVHSRQVDYPVVGKNGQFLGIIDQEEVRKLMGTPAMSSMVIVSDILLRAPTLEMKDTLQMAVRRMISSGHEELFIVADKKPIGMLSRCDIIDYYDRQMKREETQKITRKLLKEKVMAGLDANVTQLRITGLFYRISVKNKLDLFKFLAHHASVHSEEEREGLLKQLLEREAMESTGIGDGIAIPHPHERNLKGFYNEITIAVLEKPIEFGAIDNKPVDIICLVFCSDAMLHLEALKKLSVLFSKEGLAEKLRGYPSSDVILKAIDLTTAAQFKFIDFSKKKTEKSSDDEDKSPG